MNDTDRLNWLERQEGWALLSDDFGRWAVSGDGAQNVPDVPGAASDIATSFFVPKDQWYPSIRDAIDAAICDQQSRLASR